MDEDSQGAISDEDSKLSSVPPQETAEGVRSSEDENSDLENSLLSQRKSATQRSVKKKPTWSSEDDSGMLN